MVAANKTLQASLTGEHRTENEMSWLWAIAVTFLVVHVVASTICERNSRREAAGSTSEPICLLCD
jgi:ABC-type arginine transport system permease subunit